MIDHYTTEDGVTYTRDGWPALVKIGGFWSTVPEPGLGLRFHSTPEGAIVDWCNTALRSADAHAKRLAREASEACDRWREAQSESDRIHEIRWEATKR